MTSDRVERAPRAGMVLEVRYNNAGQFLVSYCTNLSRGGLFITTPTPQSVGTDISLSLQVPGRANPVEIHAKVRWLRARDDEEGSAGMGLSFADIDGLLGDHIDRLVSLAQPLSIDLVGRSDHAAAHLHALLRSLVNCQTRQLALQPGVEDIIGRPDLVVIDCDGHPSLAVALLGSLLDRSDATPVIVLSAPAHRERVQALVGAAQVLATPVDKRELQLRVLETLGRVHFVDSAGAPS